MGEQQFRTGRNVIMKIKPPWWFCCGWWSPWCVLDTIAHEVFRISMPVDDLDNPAHSDRWICRKHDKAVEERYDE